MMDKNNREYSNGEITVYWKPSECIHSTICYKNLIEVFNPLKRPWVNMQGAPTEKIIDIVNRCPTDALTFRYNKDLNSNNLANEKEKYSPEKRESDQSVKITIIKSGPVLIKGDFILTDEDGNEIQKPKTTYLCRCGHSSRMPFCDGSHKKNNFDK